MVDNPRPILLFAPRQGHSHLSGTIPARTFLWLDCQGHSAGWRCSKNPVVSVYHHFPTKVAMLRIFGYPDVAGFFCITQQLNFGRTGLSRSVSDWGLFSTNCCRVGWPTEAAWDWREGLEGIVHLLRNGQGTSGVVWSDADTLGASSSGKKEATKS